MSWICISGLFLIRCWNFWICVVFWLFWKLDSGLLSWKLLDFFWAFIATDLGVF
jgi:hypothetical protein